LLDADQPVHLVGGGKRREDTAADKAFADRIQNCKNWRSGVDIMEDFAKLMPAASPVAIQNVSSGFDAAESAFVFRMNDGSDDTNTVP
jgi:hypothetical protein